MKVDASKSIYHEAASARHDFTRAELKHLRILLRRLRFLEDRIRENGSILERDDPSAAFIEWEADALEFALDELGYLQERDK